ncbi:ketol-acid reductoisomerase [Roseivirga ehrenbergii]|uniref:Ketol-acid reductoisomerase n=1 Tax=Roseivirga ehrenbergii (strain DSM 102268 / JCM 13514 / KCTC 12282 / NCIMB 14502 / KMM 6017) TaxID=279360 RepID=A0A150X8P2_ROSEK|nr:ketol-acid reductoisomerase [Roseivirga ehrenbergii]KYG75063.1 ketol-acid reductoisomerase [Roseivirga ehrenbergii]TCL13578.1 ketol-acid reductoisomerase [Roseivirga ehrenbergii]
MAKINFGGVEENVVTRNEFPLSKAQEVLSNETVAVIGYGVQGPGQSLNLKDNGINVIVGQRKESKTWDKAVADGWVPGETLFPIEEALERGTIICYLLSDAAQIAVWPTVKRHLTAGKMLYFSHGFGVAYSDKTGIVPPSGVDVALVAPKGSGTSLRSLFVEGKGLNSSFAIHQDATGKARDRVIALGIAVGSGYLFETTFYKEVTSDLTGERGTLMGAIQGLFQAQYEVLRANGHSPSEAFNETVEEATQSLYPLIADNGMDWMYANCSTTAQRGALDWKDKFYAATKPVFEQLYKSVTDGVEAKNSIDSNSQSDYREKLEVELEAIRNSEMWQAGRAVRGLRPENVSVAKPEEELV